MNKQNIKYLFENIEELHHYLYDKTSSFSSCLGEAIYLTVITLLNNKEVTIESVFHELCLYYKYKISKTQFDIITKEYYDSILGMIIDDYNNYYLNDKYYYNGYWYDEEWVLYDEESVVIS